MKGEKIRPILEPVPPPAPSLSGYIDKTRRFSKGITQEQYRQQGLLDDPLIPTPGWQAFRQTRARPFAARAKKSGDRDKSRDFRLSLPIGLSEVNAMGMELSSESTGRAGGRTIPFRFEL
jgi:hypothetical protein